MSNGKRKRRKQSRKSPPATSPRAEPVGTSELVRDAPSPAGPAISSPATPSPATPGPAISSPPISSPAAPAGEASAVVETAPLVAGLERSTEQGDFDERYEDLVDADVSVVGASARSLTRGARSHNRRNDRRAWSARVEIRGVFSADADETVRGPSAASRGGGPRAANLSLGGVFVETTALLDVGDPVVLQLPSADGQPLSVPGRVRWVTPFGGLSDARPGMGVEFVGVDAHKQRRIEELIRRLPARAERGRS